MANYSIDIINGSGSKNIQKGNYAVSVNAKGYFDPTTLDPQIYICAAGSTGEAFTVEGAGTLIFNVNETGAAGGTPVTAGSIVMTDSTGDIEYGAPVAIGTDGNAIFEKVPHGTVDDPFTLYFKQLTTDDAHDIYEGVITVNMTADTQTEYVKNEPAALQTFTLKDATYNMPIAVATLTMTEA